MKLEKHFLEVKRVFLEMGVTSFAEVAESSDDDRPPHGGPRALMSCFCVVGTNPRLG